MDMKSLPKANAVLKAKISSRKRSISKERSLFISAFTIPPLFMYTFFLIVPCILGLFMSFFDFRGLSLKMNFVGFNNYVKMFNDPIFFKTLGNHMYVFILNTIVVFTLSIALAVVLSRNVLREKNFYRVLYFFPSAVPMVIISVMWRSIFNPSIGVLNGLLELVGIPGKVWLGDSSLVKNCVVTVMVWKSLGFYLVLFMAAVLNIPSSLYEAARIDGAGEIKQTFKITIPLIWEVVRTALVFFIITSCGVGFQVVYILTEGGPDRASELLTTYMYQQAFKLYKYGYGAAISGAILVVTMVLALIILKFTEREVYEY
ncbi:MAG TPA: sugar ABC transporter permease [Clostridiaceae bacterium]|nr:sugar ABC transporter permease [Clostridiaceae bacterium]